MFSKDPNQFRLTSAALLILGAGWIWFSAALPGGATTQGIPAPQVGFLAPDFTLQDKDGQSYTLSDLRGRPVLVNLWASWCGPCRREMPAMDMIYQKYKDDGFIILAVNATHLDTVPNAIAFAESLDLSFPIVFDHNGEVSRQYHLNSLPTSFFIGKDGIIKEVVIGGPMSNALLQTRVEKLLAEEVK